MAQCAGQAYIRCTVTVKNEMSDKAGNKLVSETETGVFPSLDRVSGTFCLSHYVTEISHLYSFRDF